MTDLIHRLAEIREQGGREPLPDPTKIEGAPMPPPVRELEPGPIPEPPWLDEDPDTVPEPDEPSPLIPRQGVPEPPGRPIIPSQVQAPDLAVIVVRDQRGASYKGKDVILLESEARAIARIVHKALGREWRESGKVLVAPRKPRRKPDAIDIKGEPVYLADSQPSPPQPTKKRRGRPKKQRLDGTES